MTRVLPYINNVFIVVCQVRSEGGLVSRQVPPPLPPPPSRAGPVSVHVGGLGCSGRGL